MPQGSSASITGTSSIGEPWPASHCLQALRLFVGEPVWTPYNRPQDEHPSRVKYTESFPITVQ